MEPPILRQAHLPLDPCSDGVLNPSGVRFGSGEIYTVLEQFSQTIDDALCVGQRRAHDKDERVLLFLKMRPGQKLTKSLIEKICSAIRKSLSARHVPAYIFEIEEIPVSPCPPIDLNCGDCWVFQDDVMALTGCFPFFSFQYTVNGKKIEIAVKQIVSGSNLQPSGTVANPDSLRLYYKFRDIEKILEIEKAKL